MVQRKPLHTKPLMTIEEQSKEPAAASSQTIASQSDATSDESNFPVYNYPLKFTILKKCSTSKARCSVLELPHAMLQTPQFMPVGTQGALKGVLPQQIKDLECNLILGNTYHLGHRPVGIKKLVK